MSIVHSSATKAAEVAVGALGSLLRTKQEVALIDVREELSYANGHILLAVSVPLSHLELRVGALVPRPGTPTVVYDGGDGKLAARSAVRLAELGYTDVRVLDGGLEAWSKAGKEVFTGLNVISKAFGEFVQHVYHTPKLGVEELKTKIDEGEDIVILDSRPLPEFEAISIPGGIDVPGAELVYRGYDLVHSPETLVVVNCAGRTRAIIGAQALVNAELFPNRVVGLENGTSAWQFAGYEPARGETNHAPDPSPEGLARAKEAASRIAARFGVQYIDAATLERFRQEADARSLFLLDVRTPPEFEAGHLPGSTLAPGGQIVQALDQYVGVQHARIVLLDGPDAVRATVTASWLNQFGLDNVFVYGGVTYDQGLDTGSEAPPILGLPAQVNFIDHDALRSLPNGGDAVIVDLAKSTIFTNGHIPGAWFAVRSRLANNVGAVPGSGPIVLTSPDGTLAHLAAADLSGRTDRSVLVLRGGTESWSAAGLPIETGGANFIDEPDDAYGPPAGDLEARRAWFADYVRWGQDVVPKIERDGTVSFRIFAQS